MVIKDINGKVISDDDLIGTGTTISLVSKDSREEIQTFTVIIYGDVSGDGEIDVVDLLLLKRQITEKINLVGAQLKASIISKETNYPDITDLLKLKRHITGKFNIEQ